MQPLTSRQRAHLKTLAHPLNAMLQVGKEGVTDALIQAIEDALRSRELIKIKVLEASPSDVHDAAGDFGKLVRHAQVVQVIGRTIVLYRRHPETPEIRLPR